MISQRSIHVGSKHLANSLRDPRNLDMLNGIAGIHKPSVDIHGNCGAMATFQGVSMVQDLSDPTWICETCRTARSVSAISVVLFCLYVRSRVCRHPSLKIKSGNLLAGSVSAMGTLWWVDIIQVGVHVHRSLLRWF